MLTLRLGKYLNTILTNPQRNSPLMNTALLFQIVPNSCATHALLSILLNCPNLELGPSLTSLRDHVDFMDPENKGLAIGNCPQLAQVKPNNTVQINISVPCNYIRNYFYPRPSFNQNTTLKSGSLFL